MLRQDGLTTDPKRGETNQVSPPKRRNSTATRIAGLVADAGLGCRFQSVMTVSGKPFAEIALLFASVGDRSHGERTILRATTHAELAAGAASFRKRAAGEFATAGLPEFVRLLLPYYCALPEVERIGPPLAEVLQSERLSPDRVIVELLSPMRDASQMVAMRRLGVSVVLRTQAPGDETLDDVRELHPDFVHVVGPPRTLEDIEAYRAFIGAAQKLGAEVIVGGVQDAEDSLAVEGLGGSVMWYGDVLAPPRFLC